MKIKDLMLVLALFAVCGVMSIGDPGGGTEQVEQVAQDVNQDHDVDAVVVEALAMVAPITVCVALPETQHESLNVCTVAELEKPGWRNGRHNQPYLDARDNKRALAVPVAV